MNAQDSQRGQASRGAADLAAPRTSGTTPSCASKKPIPSPASPAEQRGAGPAGGHGREQPRFAEPLDDGEEDRRQEDAEQRHAQHAAEHGDPQRPAHLGPGPRGHGQRDHSDDEGERGHQDRPQPQPARLPRRLVRATSPPGASAWRTRRSGWRSCTPAPPAPPGRSARRC